MVPHDRLLRRVWSPHEPGNLRVLRTHLMRLPAQARGRRRQSHLYRRRASRRLPDAPSGDEREGAARHALSAVAPAVRRVARCLPGRRRTLNARLGRVPAWRGLPVTDARGSDAMPRRVGPAAPSTRPRRWRSQLRSPPPQERGQPARRGGRRSANRRRTGHQPTRPRRPDIREVDAKVCCQGPSQPG